MRRIVNAFISVAAWLPIRWLLADMDGPRTTRMRTKQRRGKKGLTLLRSPPSRRQWVSRQVKHVSQTQIIVRRQSSIIMRWILNFFSHYRRTQIGRLFLLTTFTLHPRRHSVAKALSKPPQIFSLKGIGRLSHVHSYIKVLPKFSLKNKNACDSQLLLIWTKKRGKNV